MNHRSNVLHTNRALIREFKRFVKYSRNVEIQIGNKTGKKRTKRKGKIVLDSRITRLTCENVMRRRNVIKIYIN